MNYNKIYNDLIKSRQHLNRIKVSGDGFERHHIIPKSLGGTNDRSNLVLLTPREHFICHRLLVKMHTGKSRIKMVHALNQMLKCNQNQQRKYTSSRVYEIIRLQYLLYCSGDNHPNKNKKIHSEDTRKLISERMKGDLNPSRINGPWNKGKRGYKQALSPETIIKKKQIASDRVWTEESRAKISILHKDKPKSNEHKQKLSNINKGKKLSQETKDKMSIARKGQKQKLVTCPHCYLIGSNSAMKRWHFDNCRSL